MSGSSIRGSRQPKLVQVPTEFDYPLFCALLLDWHASLLRELKALEAKLA